MNYFGKLPRKVKQLVWVSKMCFTLSIGAQPLDFGLKVPFADIKKCFTNILATMNEDK